MSYAAVDAGAQTNYGVDVWTGPNLVTLATNLFRSPGTPAGEGYKVWFVADLNGDGLATNALRTGLIGGDNFLLKEGFINDGITADGVGNYFDSLSISKQFTNANIYVYIWNTTSAAEAGGDQFGVLSLGTNLPPLFGNATWLINSAVTANQFAVLGFATNVWNFNNSDNWSVGANWVGGAAPLSSSTNLVSFGGTATYYATNDLGNFHLNVLEFTNSAGTVNLVNPTGNRLLFTNEFGSPEIGLYGAGNAIISNGVQLAADLTILGNGAGSLTLDGEVSGTGQLTKSGSSTLVLLSSNSFAGQFTMAGGTLRIGNNGAFGTNTLRLNGGTIASTDATARQIGNQLVIAGDPTFGQSVGGTGDLDFQGVINLGGVNNRVITVNNPLTRFSGVVTNGGFTKQGSGELLLSAANRTTATITLANGSLLIGNATALGTGNFAINGGTLSSADATAYTLTNTVVVGANFNLGKVGTGALTLSSNLNFGFTGRTISVGNTLSIISGNIQNGQLTKSGSGALLLSGNNTFDSGVVLNAGTLLIGSANALDTDGVTLNGGTIASADGTARTIVNDLTIGGDFGIGQAAGGTGALTFSGAVNLNGGIRQISVDNATDTISGAIDNGGFTKIGTGTLVLSGANTFADGLAINAGVVSVANDGNLGDVNNAITFDGGTLRATGSFDMAPERTLAVNASGGTLDVTGISTLTQGGALSGTGNLTKSGPGLLVLSNNNTGFSGKVAITGGTLSVSNTINLGAVPVSTVADQLTLNGGTLRWTVSGSNEVQRGVTLGASGGTFEINSGVNLTNNAEVAGAGGFTKAGAGTLIVRPGATNSYLGKTVISAGNLNITNQNAFGATPAVATADQITVSGDATLGVSGNVDLRPERGLTIGTGGARLSVASGFTLTNYVVTGGASDRLISTNTGTDLFLVGNAGTLSSPILVHAGTVRVGADNALGTGTIYFTNGNNSRLANNNAATPVTLANAIRFDTNAILGQASTGPLNLTGVMTLAGGLDRNLTVDSSVTNTGGVVSLASEGLIKSGGGVLELTGANGYVGTTYVTNGTLRLSGAAGTVTATPNIYVDRTRVFELGATYGGDNANRLPAATTVTLNGGNFNVLNAAVTINEAFGSLVLPSNRSVVTLTPNTGTQIDLSPSSLVRSPGTLLFVRGTNLGTAAAANTSRLTFGTAPTLIGGGGGAGSTTISIAPYISLGTNNISPVGVASFVTHGANGLRLLTDAEYFTATTDISTAGATDNVSLTGAGATVTMGGDRTINALRHVSTTAKTISGAGQVLTITSGGIIVSNANLTINAGVNFGPNEGIVSLPQGGADRVLTINGPLMGSGGLILTGEGNADRLDISGTNTLTGTIYIHGGQLRLTGPQALTMGNDLFMSGGFFRLNTNNAQIGSLSGETGTIDNNAVGSSTLTINQVKLGQFNGNITNSGTAGSVMLVTKNGTAELALGNVNPFTGDFLINEGTVRLNGAGGVSTTNLVINNRSTLILDNTANNNNRLRDTGVAVQLNGGTLQFTGGTGGASSETMGTLVLNSGNSYINTARGSAAANTQVRTFTSLVRTNGATLHFIDNNLGDDQRNQIVFTAAPALTNNIIGAWTTVSNDWATYAADVDSAAGSQPSVTNLAAAQYVSGDQAANWVTGVNALLTVSTNLTASRTVSTLNMGNFDLDIGGTANTLTLTAGGILKSGSGNTRITNGILTTQNKELIVWVTGSGNLTNGAQIIDGSDGATRVVRTGLGSGVLVLTNEANSYTGGLQINQGILRVIGNGTLGTLPGSYVSNHVIIDGGTLSIVTNQLSGSSRLWPTTVGIQIGANGDNASGGIEIGNNNLTLTNRMAIVSGGTDNRLIKSGGGTLRLEQTNYYNGGTRIDAGTLTFLGTNEAGTVNAPNTVIGDLAFGTVPATVDPDNIIINSGTLQIVNNDLNTVLNSNRGIQLGAAGNANLGIIDVGNGTLAYNGVIANGGTGNALRKVGAGVLQLGGPNTYSGGTIVSAGTLSIVADQNLGAVPGVATPGNLTLSNGTLRVTGLTLNANRGIALGATGGAATPTGTIEVSNAVDTAIYNGIVAGPGNLRKTGAGVLLIGGANSYGGTTAIDDGTLRLGANEVIPDVSAVTISKGTLDINSRTETLGATTALTLGAATTTVAGNQASVTDVATGGSLILGGNVTYNAGSATFNNGQATISANLNLNGGTRTFTIGDSDQALVADTLISGIISGTGAGIIKSGAGRLVLSGNNSFDGAVSITATTGGIIRVEHASALGTTAAGTTVNTGTALELNGVSIGAEALSLSGTGISSGGALRNVTGNNSYGGAITLGAAARINSDAGTLTLSSGSALTSSFSLTLGGAGDINFDDAFAPTTTPAQTITKDGAGTLKLGNAANAYTGGTIIDSGTIKLGAAGVIPDTGTVTIRKATAAGSTSGVLDLNGNNETIAALTLGSSTTTAANAGQTPSVVNTGAAASLTLGGNVTYNAGSATFENGQATVSASLILNGNRTFTVGDGAAAVDLLVSGAVGETGGARSLTKTGAGVMVLSSTGNNYTGGTTIDSGTLRLGAANVIPNTGTVTIRRATGAGLTSGILDLNGNNETIAALTLGHTTTDVTSAGQTPSVVNTGAAATLTLGGALTYNAGSVGFENGQATISADLALGSTVRNIIVGNGAATDDLVISGAILSGGFNLTGAGTLRLDNPANAYAGDTTIRAGSTLKLGANSVLGTGVVNVAAQTAGTATLDINGKTDAVGTTLTLSSASSTALGAVNQVIDSAGGGLLRLNGTATYNAGGVGFNNGTTTISAALDLNGGTRTFDVANSDQTTQEVIISGSIQNSSGTAGLTKSGAGTLILDNNNTFNGPATVNAGGGTLDLTANGALGSVSAVNVNGGTLRISGTGGANRVNNSAPVALAGGTLAMNDTGGGLTETLGVLTLSVNSIIDLGSGSATLNFANTSGSTWTGGTILNVWNWSGNTAAQGGAGTDQLIFGSGVGTWTPTQLGQIRFYSDSGTTLIPGATLILGTGEVVPTPEPATWVSLGALASLLGWRERRRLTRLVQR